MSANPRALPDVHRHATPAAALRLVAPAHFVPLVPALARLFADAVNGGASLGFLPPLAHEESTRYWCSLRGEVQAGTRMLVAAMHGERLVGSGQLVLSPYANSPHRAEIQKLFVDRAHRGRGIGRSIVAALHEIARRRGRSLVHLSTRKGGAPESFYRGLGYRRAAVLPGWTLAPSGERTTMVTLYQEI
jgi:GNAT superfamily N-acetyltransferase